MARKYPIMSFRTLGRAIGLVQHRPVTTAQTHTRPPPLRPPPLRPPSHPPPPHPPAAPPRPRPPRATPPAPTRRSRCSPWPPATATRPPWTGSSAPSSAMCAGTSPT
ncbi:hypothetical protein DRB89_42035 [Streptomyces sp. ICC4]|nr:hypothetical protein DRB89_42035 [Streptomyces sp. ICC4]